MSHKYKYSYQEPIVSKVTRFLPTRGGRLPSIAIKHIYKSPDLELDLSDLKHALTQLLEAPKK